MYNQSKLFIISGFCRRERFIGGLNGTVVITPDQKDSDSKGLKLVEKQVTNKVNFVGENSNVRLKGTTQK